MIFWMDVVFILLRFETRFGSPEGVRSGSGGFFIDGVYGDVMDSWWGFGSQLWL